MNDKTKPAEEMDDSEMWRLFHQHQQEKRASNRENSTGLLQRIGVTFKSHNFGAHLVVSVGTRMTDFWPGTGRWRERGGAHGFGVFNMLRHLGVKFTRAQLSSPTPDSPKA